MTRRGSARTGLHPLLCAASCRPAGLGLPLSCPDTVSLSSLPGEGGKILTQLNVDAAAGCREIPVFESPWKQFTSFIILKYFLYLRFRCFLKGT